MSVRRRDRRSFFHAEAALIPMPDVICEKGRHENCVHTRKRKRGT